MLVPTGPTAEVVAEVAKNRHRNQPVPVDFWGFSELHPWVLGPLNVMVGKLRRSGSSWAGLLGNLVRGVTFEARVSVRELLPGASIGI